MAISALQKRLESLIDERMYELHECVIQGVDKDEAWQAYNNAVGAYETILKKPYTIVHEKDPVEVAA